MIEVNLLPGGKKRASKGFSFSLPSFGGAGIPGAPDPYILFFTAAIIVGLGYMGWTFLGSNAQAEELEANLVDALQDSANYASRIQEISALTEQRNSIAARVNVIQEIDAGRYVWPHLLDEIAAAVPEYTWLREVLYVSDNPLQVRVTGRAGSMFAITNFWRRLEASRFLRGVTMDRTEQQPAEESPEDLVYVFELLLSYESPPIDELQSVPLFEDESVAAPAAVPDTTGG